MCLKSKKWEMFKKWDSINLETEYRRMIIARKQNKLQQTNRTGQSEEPVSASAATAAVVQVLDNMYEVNLDTRKCYPIYQKCGRKMRVQRCVWYRDTNEPFDEHVGDEIEKRHVDLFRDSLVAQIMSPSPSANSPVDSTSSNNAATATFMLDDPQDNSSVESISMTNAPSSSSSSKTNGKSSKNESKGQIERNFSHIIFCINFKEIF